MNIVLNIILLPFVLVGLYLFLYGFCRAYFYIFVYRGNTKKYPIVENEKTLELKRELESLRGF